MSAKVLATIVGARPQFIKAATVCRAFRAIPGVEERLIHTGQHHDDNMSAQFFRDLEIPDPWVHLSISGGGHGAMTGRMLIALEQTLSENRPDAILVYGDTNSTLAGALTAAKMHIPLVHVESGLRSFNRMMPEEINRIITDQLSSLLFCPTQTSVANLAREGIVDHVETVGDVNFDAARFAISRLEAQPSLFEGLGIGTAPFTLCTLHRAENLKDPARLKRIVDYIEDHAARQRVVLPLHPHTRNVFAQNGIDLRGVTVIPPAGYFEFHALLARCDLVMTDSGGTQKEAYFHGKPCITLRDETEWVETVTSGWNRLWTSDTWVTPRTQITDYGDGHAADYIAQRIATMLGV